ncbi:MAG TPA: terminase large subunit, partial [Candidatus Dojkabacteria bacterium]|nr:terminase large subunit [Candidatus Dojkabacteria bacterium]
MGYLDKINSYVNDVLSNKIPSCQWVKKACERFHSDLNKGDYYFDENAVDDVISFIRKLKLNTTPKKPFLLEDWQLFIIANIYGLKSKLNNRRKYKYVYIEIPRKNGKSELITALALYHFIFDELATITVSANSREQAKNVDFKKIKSFAHQLDRREKYIIPYFNSLKMNGRQNEIIVTSSDAKRLDGLNISVGIIDELHSAKDSGVYDVIKSAMGSREEPLLIVITTAGFDVDSFCYNLRNHITDILNGVTIDESQFGIIYTLDEGDDIADENNWVKANPNLGVSLSIDFIRDEVNKAQNSPSETAGVLVKNFNLWQKKSSEKSWINEAYLEKVFAPVNIEDYRGADCMVGLDLGTNTDLTCFSICIKVQNGEYVFFTKYYLPE